MLIHLISFKYKADVDETARQLHRERLRTLRGIEGVLDLKVGGDVVRSARSYDTGLLVVFSDRSALDAYQKHPQHVPVAALGVSLSDHIVAVDFDA